MRSFALELLPLGLASLSVITSCGDPISEERLIDHRMAVLGFPFSGNGLNYNQQNVSGINVSEQNSDSQKDIPGINAPGNQSIMTVPAKPGTPMPEDEWFITFGENASDEGFLPKRPAMEATSLSGTSMPGNGLLVKNYG